MINRIVVAVDVVIRAVGVTRGVSLDEAPEFGVVVTKAEVVEADGFGAFLGAELAGLVRRSGGADLLSERGVVGGRNDCSIGVGHRHDGAHGVVGEEGAVAPRAVLGVQHAADPAAHAGSADELFCQRARGVVFLDVDAAVVNIIGRLGIFNLAPKTPKTLDNIACEMNLTSLFARRYDFFSKP